MNLVEKHCCAGFVILRNVTIQQLEIIYSNLSNLCMASLVAAWVLKSDRRK